jgi:hypothetical protein
MSHHFTQDHWVISPTEHHFTHYLNAWNYVQKHSILNYAIEKIGEHIWKLTILTIIPAKA